MEAHDSGDPVQRYISLSQRLSQISTVENKGRRRGEPESATLAHALLDIEDVCRRVTTAVMPRLTDTSATDSDILDSLAELGELFRHFLYHVRDPYYFRYLPGCEHGNGDGDEQT
jgi:hypothetical protein